MDMFAFLFASDGRRWNAEDYSNCLEQAFVSEMGEEIGIREYRQISAALSSQHLSKWLDVMLDGDEATFEQQGHTTETHDRDYDRVTGQSHGVPQHDQLRYELASIQWQKLVFPSSLTPSDSTAMENDAKDSGQRPLADTETVPSTPPFVPASILPSSSPRDLEVSLAALRALRRILKNDKATFRTVEQAQATMAMQLQEERSSSFFGKDLLVILPTGAGKTLTWLVASELESQDRLTVVIVPLNALLHDMASRLTDTGRQVHLSKPGVRLDLERLSGIFLISVDRVVQDDAIAQLHAWEHRIVSGRCAACLNGVTHLVCISKTRIVFDEAHIAHIAKDYRAAMLKLENVMKARPPIALFTGTCGPTMEKDLLDTLGLKDVKTIRATTNRPEIVYSVSPAPPVSDSALPAIVVGWFRANLADHLLHSKSQVLIYVPKKTIGRDIANQMDVPFFESNTAQDEKMRMLDEFRRGVSQVLVATAAFGAGIDIGTVDVVVHAGSPRSMVDFVQESGRAGRGSLWALSIVFRSFEVQVNSDSHGEKEMHEWLHRPSICRRIGISDYMDGMRMTCSGLPNGNLCDTCRSMGMQSPSIEDELPRKINSRKEWNGTNAGMDSALLSPFISQPRSVPTVSGDFRRPAVAATPVGKDHGAGKFAMPETPSLRGSMKRSSTTDRYSSDASAKRRTAIAAMTSSDLSPTLNSTRTSCAEPSSLEYAERTMPLLASLIRKSGGVCFLCLGQGKLRFCPAGRCAMEGEMLGQGPLRIWDLVNELGDGIRFKLEAVSHCQRCYLPAVKYGETNGFHPSGPEGKCYVFAMAVPKALVCASSIWSKRVSVGSRETVAGDPLWFKDLLVNTRTLPEPSKTNFAKIMMTKCETGDLWLVRVFCRMLEEALR